MLAAAEGCDNDLRFRQRRRESGEAFDRAMISPLSPRERLEEANETIRHLRAAMRLPDGMCFEGITLTKVNGIIVWMLLEANGPCSATKINDRLELALNRSNSVSDSVVSLYISRLRKKLSILDPPVRIKRIRPVGYWMEPTDKARLLERRVKTTKATNE